MLVVIAGRGWPQAHTPGGSVVQFVVCICRLAGVRDLPVRVIDVREQPASRGSVRDVATHETIERRAGERHGERVVERRILDDDVEQAIGGVCRYIDIAADVVARDVYGLRAVQEHVTASRVLVAPVDLDRERG